MERTKNERHTNFKWEMNYIRRLKKDRKKNQRRKLQDKRCYKNLREQRIHFWFANKRKKKKKERQAENERKKAKKLKERKRQIKKMWDKEKETKLKSSKKEKDRK